MDFKDYQKFRWFFTLSGKLVIGGKNALQNDELMSYLKSIDMNLMVMHTHLPGSPFTVIFSDIKELTKKDMEECAVFTACFSQLWKSGTKMAEVDSFYSSKLYKSKDMKLGTWGVKDRLNSFKVSLGLVLTVQEGVLRAVPEKSVKKKEILLRIKPGKQDKTTMINEILSIVKGKFKYSDILSALPAGGVNISK